jgi:hypothetical protein
MPRRDPLTPEQKWLAVTRFATALPVLYDVTFRERVGEDWDRLEQQVWVRLASTARDFAASSGLPARNAGEIMETLGTLLLALFGPEFRMEDVPIDEGRAVLMIRRCPFAFREAEVRGGPENLLPRCLAFSIATVEALNPAFTLRFVRSMCMGDRTCELKVMRREDAERDDAR